VGACHEETLSIFADRGRTAYLARLLSSINSHQKNQNTEMKTRLHIVLTGCFVVAAGLVLSACRMEPTSGNRAHAAGVYALVSVDGKPVPASLSHEGATIEVRSGTFTINADGTCSSKTVFVPPSGTEVAREVSATYTKNGSTLNMKWKDAGTTVGTIQANNFTMNNEGMVFVYTK
jgi:hypothetical protein